MFQELMASIWEEFIRVIFHVEVNIEPAAQESVYGEQRGADQRPASGRRRGAAVGDRRGARPAPPAGGAAAAAAAAPRPVQGSRAGTGAARAPASTRRPSSRPSRRRSAATIPAGAGRARSTRSATAPERGRQPETIEALLGALRDRDRAASPLCSIPRSRRSGRRGRSAGSRPSTGWAKPSDDGHLRSSVEVDEVRELPGDRVAVAARRQWRWVDAPRQARRRASVRGSVRAPRRPRPALAPGLRLDRRRDRARSRHPGVATRARTARILPTLAAALASARRSRQGADDETKIVGGGPVNVAQVPWQVALAHSQAARPARTGTSASSAAARWSRRRS